VVGNQDFSKTIATRVKIPDLIGGGLETVTPEQSDAVPTDGTQQLPARSPALMMER
jgi:hypothetical protein